MRPAPGEHVVDLRPPPHRIDWSLARQLLAALRALRGDDLVARAAKGHRAALSLVFRAMPALGAREEAQAVALAPTPHGYLSHNWSVALPLRRAVATLLRRLVGQTPMLLRVHDGAWVEPEDADLLLALARPSGPGEPTVRAAPVRLAVALDLHAAPRDATGREGMRESQRLWMAANGRDGAVRRAAPSTAEPPEAPQTDPWHDGAEERAFARLADPRPLSRDARARVIAAVDAAFASLSFGAACALGEALVARGGNVARAERAHLHTTLAVATYNQKVRSEGDLAYAAMIRRHLDEALAAEAAPARRAHLLYRATIQHGRREGDLDRAARCADEAVGAATTPLDEAWARNGRAYVYVRRNDLRAAIHDTRRALACLSRRDVGGPRCERFGSVVGLTSNLAWLLLEAGDLRGARRLAVRAATMERAFAGAATHGAPMCAGIEARAGRWGNVRAWATRLAREADALGLTSVSAEARELLGEAHENSGAYALAARAWGRARALHARLGDEGATLSAAVVEARNAARAGLACDEALRALRGGPPEAHAHALAAEALRAAVSGRNDEADRLGNEALALAVAEGAETTAAVLMTLGEALTRMGRHDEARGARAEAERLGASSGGG